MTSVPSANTESRSSRRGAGKNWCVAFFKRVGILDSPSPNLVVFLAGRIAAGFRRSKTMHELRGESLWNKISTVAEPCVPVG